METYKVSGKDILSKMVGVDTDSKGNEISEWENYIILKEKGEVIVVPEKYYYYSLKKAVSMIYKQFGFSYTINIVDGNEALTLEEKNEIIDGMLEIFVENEDYEVAEQLKMDYKNYLNE